MANKIDSTVPFLVNFLLYPSMQSTNNHAKRELRCPILYLMVSG